MSTPIDQIPLQPPPPPPLEVTQQAYTTHSGHGSVGPVIGVLAVIIILGAIAVMIGRLCSGHRIFRHGQQYDLEGWLEKKCSTCIDGRIDPPPPHRPQAADIRAAEPVARENTQEIKEEGKEQEQQEEGPEQAQQQHQTHASTSSQS